MMRRSKPHQPDTPEKLEQRIEEKKARLKSIQEEYEELIKDMEEEPKTIVDRHISSLKNYNELRDVAMGFVAKIAEQQRTTIADVLKQMGAPADLTK